MSDIYAEIEQEWQAIYETIECEVPSRAEFSELCAEAEIENRREALQGLQPWLGILACFSNWPVEVKRFQAFLPIGY